jgi:hypothetical protein
MNRLAVAMRSVDTIRTKLTDFEQKILLSLSIRKVMLTGQIVTLCCPEKTPATIRQTQRILNKLKDMGLILSRQYRQAGEGYITTSYVWGLSKQGLRVVFYGSPDLKTRLKYWSKKANQHTGNHILAINDTEITLRGLVGDNFKIEKIVNEPSCWRKFDDDIRDGVWLKPDMYLETSRLIDDNRYRFRWWLEIDLSTERPHRVLDKCDVYVSYWRNVQPPTLPVIVWVVPDNIRKKSLEPKIQERFDKIAQIFKVVTVGELSDLMLDWLPNRGNKNVIP